uniref:Uncharacterized protein n=1 Tax=Oryza punctata TaxID=4537 RepID=A0A0E0LD74_ORYPU
MADRATHYLLLQANQQGIRRHHHGRLLLDTGCFFMLLAAVILTAPLLTTGGALSGTLAAEPYDAFVALLLWLLGAALTMLSLVAGQFPALAAAAVAIAMQLRNYLLRGL